MGAHGPSTTGSSGVMGHGSTNAGPHSSNAANKLDPRVDSDLDNRGPAMASGGFGSAHTAGSTNHGYVFDQSISR